MPFSHAKLKLLKVKDVFTLNKLKFMFDHIKGCIPDEIILKVAFLMTLRDSFGALRYLLKYSFVSNCTKGERVID